ncbi:site-specific integrase [Brevibacillus choshinensis]|uniref:Site-specific integrase n=1 Tax=Brevibacillus choshinensis TaxID=54911 RepID=A0ABX7FHN1_BRECH|nr:tyrosine-type recombinase/integrase [Brevibacillus choshinensis]QRG65288.1 site-specific integrase [Brevibacillus choshinensis]
MASIEKRGANSYRLIVELGYDANGKRIKRSKTVKATGVREAKLELAKFVTEVSAGEYITPEKMTFSSFVDNEWMKKFAERELSPGTLKIYLVHLQTHINPVFGHKQLEQIKTLHVVTFLNDLRNPEARRDGKNGILSDSTILYIYKVLKSVLSKATDWRLIQKNPMEGVKQPKVEKRKMKFYDAEEAKAVIMALYKEPAVWRLYFLGAIIGGFRRGELLALEWTDVHFEENTLSIRKSISLTENGSPIIGKTKTAESERVVVMPAWYMRELREYLREWKKEKLQTGVQWLGEDRQFVFHNGHGKPYHHTTPTGTWRKFIKRHSLKFIRLHDLRHTAATLLIEAGVDLKAVQERLGHTKYSTTADFYAHVTKKVSKDAASKLDKFDPKLFGPQSVPKG